MLGGVVAATMALLPPRLEPQYLYYILNGVTPLLLLGGVIGLYIQQADGFGRMGAFGFFAVAASLLGAALRPWVVIAGGGPPTPGSLIGTLYGVAGLLGFVGFLFLGIATLRAKILALPWRVLPLAIFLLSVLSAFLPALIGSVNPSGLAYFALRTPQVLIGFTWVLLGYTLWSGTGVNVRRSAPAR